MIFLTANDNDFMDITNHESFNFLKPVHINMEHDSQPDEQEIEPVAGTSSKLICQLVKSVCHISFLIFKDRLTFVTEL